MPHDIDIPKEKCLNYLQTVKTLIRHRRSGYALFSSYLFRGVSSLQWVNIFFSVQNFCKQAVKAFITDC